MQAQDLAQATKEQLVERYVQLGTIAEELEAEKLVLKEEILARLKNNGEVIGDYTVTRVKQQRFNFGKVTVEEARPFGAVKETVDNEVLKKLYTKGIKLPFEVMVAEIEYPLIKAIEVKE